MSDGVHQASFDANGFAVDGLGFHLSSIGRGKATAVEASAWSGRGNIAERAVGRGMTERVTANEGTLEWDVVLNDRPAGEGDLVVSAATWPDCVGQRAQRTAR